MNKTRDPPRRAVLAGIAFLFLTAHVISGDVMAKDLSLEDVRAFHSSFMSHNMAAGSSLAKAGLLESRSFQMPRQEGVSLGMGGGSAALSGLVSVSGKSERLVSQFGIIPASGRANIMDIEVTGITVIAINAAPGGSAAATSNIVIQPVQMSGCSGAAGALSKRLR
ncbi:MAG: hypothetical protein JW986_06730 [Methanotrichaceae archaeon]|nr:hypothetical protein [Methanotrichaceae archaeon]